MKLRNKLILSCAALAAVATTAVSTTYAWYTSNTEVTVDGVSGKTKQIDSSVLMISTDAYNWGSKIHLTINPQNMIPVTTADNGLTFQKWDDATNKPFDADTAETPAEQRKNAVAGTDYISFDLYFKSGTTDSLNVFVKEFNLVNTTASFTPKIKLNNAGLDGITATTYTVNMFRALTIDQICGATKERLASDAAYAAVTADATSSKVWDAQSLASKKADSLGETFNAHEYYNAVKGLDNADATTGTADDPIDTAKGNSEATRSNLLDTSAEGYASSSWKLGVTGAGSADSSVPSDVLKVTFNIYLDGWDKACFDACQGQTFSLDMVFESTKVTA